MRNFQLKSASKRIKRTFYGELEVGRRGRKGKQPGKQGIISQRICGNLTD